MRRQALIVAAMLACTITPAPATAQRDTGRVARRIETAADSVLEARTSALASELRCPVCQGNSIQDSPSELAQQMRDLIRDQLRAGKTPDEVRAYFVDKYGEWILLRPKATGFNLVVYLAPLAFILIGGAIVWRTVRRWTAAAPGSPADRTSSR
jgi:cytochrome c-type biogenesis protein CcmH